MRPALLCSTLVVAFAVVPLARADPSASPSRFSLHLDAAFPVPLVGPAEAARTVFPDVSPAPPLPPDYDGFASELSVDLLGDVRALLRLPREMNRTRWRRLGLGLGAVALATTLDKPINRWADRHRNHETLEAGSALRPLGQEGGAILLGAAWLLGKKFDRPQLAAIGRDGLEAVALSGLVVTPVIKWVAGRPRPRSTLDSDNSRPFGGGQSFSSGEAAQAFAIASVIAARSDRRWVKGVAYGVATLVSLSRIELDGHWASDVVAGALIGSAIGHWVVARHRGDRSEEARVQWSVAPSYDVRTGSGGLAVSLSF